MTAYVVDTDNNIIERYFFMNKKNKLTRQCLKYKANHGQNKKIILCSISYVKIDVLAMSS